MCFMAASIHETGLRKYKFLRLIAHPMDAPKFPFSSGGYLFRVASVSTRNAI
jgi:hypothetical protein